MNQERSPSPTSSDALEAPLAMGNTVEKLPPAKRARKNNKRSAKRFLWHEDLHLRFVAAIFDLGLKNASPKALLPLMQASDPDSALTTEHLKSHLQKYRLNYERSRQEFREICHREVKRNQKRRRREKSAASAYIFPSQTVKAHNDSSKNETDSDSEGGKDTSNTSTEEQGLGPSAGASFSAPSYPTLYRPVQQTPDQAPVMTPELTDAQWRTFCLLMSATPQAFNGDVGDLSVQAPHDLALSSPQQAQVQEDLETQMHQAMQAQMHFHRQMLTRKVELSHHLSGMTSYGAGGHGVSDGSFDSSMLEPSRQGFESWVTSQQQNQQPLVSAELNVQVSPPPAFEAAVQSGSLSSLISTESKAATDARADNVGDDLNRWDPFSVDLDGGDLFDFLRT